MYIGDVTEEVIPEPAPLVEFSKTINQYYVYLKGQYFVAFGRTIAQTFYLEEEFAYNFDVLSMGILTFNLENQNNFYIGDSYDGVLEPSASYLQDFSFGALLGKIGFHINYGPSLSSDNYLKAGYYKFGFGLELTGTWNISPSVDMRNYEIVLNYMRKKVFYVELEFDADHTFTIFALKPNAEFYLGKVTLWAEVDFLNLGKNQDSIIMPYIGASYSF